MTPGGLTRVLLTWRLEGDVLVTDQMSQSHVERQAVSLLPGGELMLGEGVEASRYVKDDDKFGLDPDARLYAIAGTALRHAIASVPFTPFLMTQTAKKMDLIRIDDASADDAARAQAGQLLDDVTLCAWTTDGELILEGEKTYAVFAVVSERGRFASKTFALRYRLTTDGTPEPFGGFLVTAEGAGWLRASAG